MRFPCSFPPHLFDESRREHCLPALRVAPLPTRDVCPNAPSRRILREFQYQKTRFCDPPPVSTRFASFVRVGNETPARPVRPALQQSVGRASCPGARTPARIAPLGYTCRDAHDCRFTTRRWLRRRRAPVFG